MSLVLKSTVLMYHCYYSHPYPFLIFTVDIIFINKVFHCVQITMSSGYAKGVPLTDTHTYTPKKIICRLAKTLHHYLTASGPVQGIEQKKLKSRSKIE